MPPHPRHGRRARPCAFPFDRQYRNDGHGHPAYDSKTLLGVLLYGYCIGVRSSRQLERRCHEDIAFRVLAANQTAETGWG
jgi:transposase